jgi:hypothetical protein
LVERKLPKLEVAGSTPVVRFRFPILEANLKAAKLLRMMIVAPVKPGWAEFAIRLLPLLPGDRVGAKIEL